MDARSTHRLRARITRLAVDHPRLTPDQIARQLGCSRSTVYKFLRAPGRDRRTTAPSPRVHTAPAVVLAAHQLFSRDPSLSASAMHAALAARAAANPAFPPVLTARTIGRLLASFRDDVLRSDASLFENDPEDPAVPADSDLSAIDALRDLQREAREDLACCPRNSPLRFRLRQQVAAIAAMLARADQLRPAVEPVAEGTSLDVLSSAARSAT